MVLVTFAEKQGTRRVRANPHKKYILDSELLLRERGEWTKVNNEKKQRPHHD